MCITNVFSPCDNNNYVPTTLKSEGKYCSIGKDFLILRMHVRNTYSFLLPINGIQTEYYVELKLGNKKQKELTQQQKRIGGD